MTAAAKQLPIRGAGGGKGGGGSARTPVESPDTLRSKQYARVLDLICEGEIEGLVDGLKSVYLDDVPLVSANGRANFQGVTVHHRQGTQDQTYIAGFPAVEAENSVGVEITNGTPIVRSISDPNINAARVTISVPRLTFQSTETGDIKGTTVELAIDVQSDGGGYVAQPLSRRVLTLNSADGATLIQGSEPSITIGATVLIDFPDISGFGSYKSPSIQTCSYRVEYRIKDSGSGWTTLATQTVSSRDASQQYSNPFTSPSNILSPPQTATFFLGGTTYQGFPSVSRDYDSGTLAEATYEIRVVKTGGDGDVSLTEARINVPKYSAAISGKTTNRYQRSFHIDLPGNPPWDIRVRRLTADSSQSNLSNKTFFDSYTSIIDAKLRYPNSALVGMEIDSAQFQAIPRRGYLCKLLRVKVPNNYDPLARTYDGSWDGTFKIAWTDNPAWCFYDIITEDRYGLGEFVDESVVDKWALYSIAQYCDELVPDGYGGMEPRFTCNLYLQSRNEAYQVVKDMASIFRAMTYWSAGAITAVADKPADPIALYTPANVIDGRFEYAGSARTARHTVALVSWNDPNDHYKTKVEYVEDKTGIERYGIVETEIVAVGCSSRGQANRVGKMTLTAERLETETVTFQVGLDGTLTYPGAVIKTSDPNRAGKRFGGRILSATASEITIDSAVEIEAGKSYTLSVILPDGTLAERELSNGAGSTDTLTPVSAFSAAPLKHAIWILAADDLNPELWRVQSIAESDTPGQFTITALAHEPGRYALVEDNVEFEILPTSAIQVGEPSQPANLTFEEELYLAAPSVVGNRVTLSWEQTAGAWRYRVSWRELDGNWRTLPDTDNLSVDIDGVQPGDYEFRVVAISGIGYESDPAIIEQTVRGKSTPPVDVTGFTLEVVAGTAQLEWTRHPDLDVQIGGEIVVRHSPATGDVTWQDGVEIARFDGGGRRGTAPLLSGTYMAKAVDSTGNFSSDPALIVTNAPQMIQFNFIEELIEQPGFDGTRTNVSTAVNSDGLQLIGADTIGERQDNVSEWNRIASLGGIVPEGSYQFGPLDLGAVETSHLTARVRTTSFNTGDTIGSRGLVSEWDSIIGDTINDTDATLYVRTTDDDPNGAPEWGEWRPFRVSDYTARGFEFRLDLMSGDVTHNIRVDQLEVTVDMPDRVVAGEDMVAPSGGLSVTFDVPFRVKPAIGITAEQLQTGDTFTLTNKSKDGFDIAFTDSGGNGVERTFDYIAKAY